MSKNVAVFVDVANIFYAAKAAGVDIDYVTLLKSATAGRDFIRAYAYTGLDPENENQRQFQNFLGRNGYKVVSKDIRKYGDGKVKANLDIELVVDMMKTARNVDIAVVVSGDGDFAPAIRAVQEMGVRVEVISFRGNTSSDLIEVADTFTDITQLAKVEKSSRSGRRVAASAEDDLSMTAVPDKETEGAPRRRRRTTKPATDDSALGEVVTPVAGAAARTRAPRGVRSLGVGAAVRVTPAPRATPIVAARSAAEAIAAAGMTAPLRVLPGEHLSRVVTTSPDVATPADLPVAAVVDVGPVADAAWEAQGIDALEAAPGADAVRAESSIDGAAEPAPQGQGVGATGEAAPAEGEARRRRRRRGGRGRGRGRGRDREGLPREGLPGEAISGEASSGDALTREGLPREATSVAETDDSALDGEDEAEPVPYAPFRAPQSTFGSIWDSQLGMNVPSRPAPDTEALEADEDLEEPAIPEYLLAERRRSGQLPQGGRGIRGRGGRGGRGAYAAALDRERYGKTGAPSTGWSPDRGGRPDRGPRRDRRPGSFQGQSRPSSFERPPSAEPWSEVPPDLEEQIRAQLATRNQPAQTAGQGGPARTEPQAEPQREFQSETSPAATTGPDPVHATTTRRRPGAAAQRRPTRSRPTAGSGSVTKAGPEATAISTGSVEAKASPTARRGRGRTAANPGDQPSAPGTTEATAAANPAGPVRGRRRMAANAAPASASSEDAAEAPKRRPPARKAPEA